MWAMEFHRFVTIPVVMSVLTVDYPTFVVGSPMAESVDAAFISAQSIYQESLCVYGVNKKWSHSARNLTYQSGRNTR